MTPQRLGELARQWRRILLARELGFALGATGLAAALVAAWPGRPASAWLLPPAVLAGTLALRSAAIQWRELDAARLARHLDRVHPELEESSRLWLRAPEELTLLERLQLRRINTAVVAAAPGGPGFGQPPRGFLRAGAVCGTLGTLLLAITAFTMVRQPTAGHRATLSTLPAPPAASASAPPVAAPAWPKLTGGSLTITPPAYTARPVRQVDGLGAEIEEGATVAWSVALDLPVRDARLVFGDAGTDTLPLALAPGGQRLAARRAITETALYHLAATLPDGRVWNPPDLYSLRVLKDRPPTVRIVRPEQPRTVIDPPAEGQPAPRVEVEVAAGDDYGVGEAHLVATVAKGSGEAVKFHEQTFPFDSDAPDPAAPHGRTFRRTLDFGALGLEPGDELYFFVEVLDNRQPTPNRARSETRFLVLKGPEESAPSAGLGVAGVNLVPQYFRSERQIIIDTEKLIADRPHISDHELRQRSNDLGGDQQLLRLRYGQFLGEDMEQGLGDHTEISLDPLQAAPPEPASGPHAAASTAQRFLQEHEEQDREGGSDEQRDASAHAAPEVPLTANQVVAPYVDQHDSQDKATFFDHQTKGTMRDALDAMWSAERHLRVMQLDDALAPEHKALDILKDLQQSARAYVQHVGFEPPPLKVAQRRLKGDVADVPPRAAQVDPLPPDDPALGAVRAALADLPWQRPPPVVLTPEETDRLRQVQPALTQAATRQPEAFLDGLQALRQRLASAGDTAALPPALEHALLRLLPPAGPLPARAADASPALARAYADALRSAAPTGGTPP